MSIGAVPLDSRLNGQTFSTLHANLIHNPLFCQFFVCTEQELPLSACV